MRRRDWLTPGGLGLAVLAVTSVPLAYAVVTAPPGHVFMGFFVNGADMNSYLAKLREGAEGHWAWINRYTTEPADPTYLFLFLLAWGHLGALLHLSPMAAFQLFRASGAVALLLGAAAFVRRYLPDASAWRRTLLLLTFSMGYGILIWAAGAPVVFGAHLQALDLRMPELSIFMSVLTGPTWTAALAAVASVAALRAAESSRPAPAVLAGLAWLAEAAMHPQTDLVLWTAVVAACLVRRPAPRAALALGAAALPALALVGYAAWAAGTPEVRLWHAQGVDSVTHDPISLAVGLLPLLVPAPFGLVRVLRRRTRDDVFLVAWIVVVGLATWIPSPASSIGGRFVDAIFLPLGVLAGIGLWERIVPALKSERARRLVPFSYLAVSAITPAFVVLALVGVAHAPQYSLTTAELGSLSWLDGRPRGAVLASADMGVYVPAYAGDTAYVGHYSETYRYAAKASTAAALLSGRGDISGFARAHGIRYVLWTAADSAAPPPGLGPPAFYEPGAAVFDLGTRT